MKKYNTKDVKNNKKKLFFLLGGGILVIVLIIVLAATGAFQNGNDQSDKKDLNDVQSQTEEGQQTDDGENTENTAVTDGEDENDAVDQDGQTSSAANGSAAGSSSAGSGSSGSSSSGSSGTSSQSGSHKHVWADHVTTVTVEDEPARSEKVTQYRLYWWDTKQWTTTEDSSVFNQWQREKVTWIKEYGSANCPDLFLGYDANGNPQYTNDHSIITSYKTVPAVTHQEKKVDYQYCTICGARKN